MTFILNFSLNARYVTHMPHLKVLSKIFSKLLHAKTNLCGSNGGIIGLDHILVSTMKILKDPITIISQKLTLHVTKVCKPQFSYR